MNRAERKICVTLLRYNVKKQKNRYSQVPLVAKEKESEKYQQILNVNSKLEDFIYLFDVMNSVFDKFNTNELSFIAL